MKFSVLVMALAGFGGSMHAAWGASHEVVQKNKGFTPGSLAIKVGDTVSFKNEDVVSHNVFSLSDTSMFDLGSYPKGQARTVTFAKPGTVEVECAIHPSMTMTIEVTK